MKRTDGFRFDLQFHPYLKGDFDLLDILRTMEEKGLTGIGLLYYEWEPNISLEIYKKIDPELRKQYSVEVSENLLIFTNKITTKPLYIILGQEVGVGGTKREWHILSIGAYGIPPAENPEEAIEEILRKGGLVIIDHPFADPSIGFRDLNQEKEEKLIDICQKYRGKIALEWNGYCISWLRKLLPGYGDVNQKVEQLGENIPLPVVPTTDLHARSSKLLKALGTSFIEIPLKDSDLNPGNLLSALKRNVLSSIFRTHKEYVSFWHFVRAYDWPPLFFQK